MLCFLCHGHICFEGLTFLFEHSCKLVQSDYAEGWKRGFGGIVEMTVICDDEVCMGDECTIYKLIIILILLNQAKAEVRVFSVNVSGAGYNFHKQVRSSRRCLSTENLLVFK